MEELTSTENKIGFARQFSTTSRRASTRRSRSSPTTSSRRHSSSSRSSSSRSGGGGARGTEGRSEHPAPVVPAREHGVGRHNLFEQQKRNLAAPVSSPASSLSGVPRDPRRRLPLRPAGSRVFPSPRSGRSSSAASPRGAHGGRPGGSRSATPRRSTVPNRGTASRQRRRRDGDRGGPPKPAVYVIPDSDPNAFATGSARNDHRSP